jgi:hypothetical protein
MGSCLRRNPNALHSHFGSRAQRAVSKQVKRSLATSMLSTGIR